MMTRRSGTGATWAVVLAGGEGERVRPLVQRWLGRHRPKQYCTFTGTRSMFQPTVHRALALTHPQHVVTIAAHAHRSEVTKQLEELVRRTGVGADARDSAPWRGLNPELGLSTS